MKRQCFKTEVNQLLKDNQVLLQNIQAKDPLRPPVNLFGKSDKAKPISCKNLHNNEFSSDGPAGIGVNFKKIDAQR